MGLLDLVEREPRRRASCGRPGELAVLFVAHVSPGVSRKAVLPCPFRRLRHVEADQAVLVAEKELGERLPQLGLAHARGPSEGNDPPGRRGSFRPARVRRTARSPSGPASAGGRRDGSARPGGPRTAPLRASRTPVRRAMLMDDPEDPGGELRRPSKRSSPLMTASQASCTTSSAASLCARGCAPCAASRGSARRRARAKDSCSSTQRRV